MPVPAISHQHHTDARTMPPACQIWFYPQSFGTAPKQTLLSTEDSNGRIGLQIVAMVNRLTGALGMSACFDGGCTTIPDILEISRYITGAHLLRIWLCLMCILDA